MCWVDYEGYMWVYKVLWGVMGVIYVLYLLCYVKGIYELREGYWGGEGVIHMDVIVWMCFIWGYVWVYGGLKGVILDWDEGVIILDWCGI